MTEIRGLTGLRGIAALIVFFAHTRETLESRGVSLEVSTLLKRLFLSGGRQVDIFFVLSGFILALIYQSWFGEEVKRSSYVKFLQRRFARIYPLHAFMLILTIGVVVAAHLMHSQTVNGLDRFTVASLPATFLLVHAWGFVGGDGGPWNPPSWSVSIEALGYLVFPLFIWSTARIAKSAPWALVGGLAVCGFLVNWMVPWGLAGTEGIARGLTEFTFGCATANLFSSPVSTWLQSRIGSLVAAAGLVLCFALTPDTGFVIAFFTAPLLLALSGDNAVSRVLGSGPIYFLGEISYSIYLGHFLLSTISYRLISPVWMQSGPLQTTLGIIGIIVFVLSVATLMYHFVERPGRDLLRGRKKTAPAPLAAAAAGDGGGP
jgi:peptidoglycan/LPS O-acetylase OafA/YrhL